MSIQNKVQLITYADGLGGDLQKLHTLLQTHFKRLFAGGVHLLPPFPSSADRGFAPTTYFKIAPQFGTWEDIHQMSQQQDIALDLMVNHISRQSDYFQDFVQKGRASEYADLFITLEKVWADGTPPPADVAKIFLRKPDNPFTTITVQETGAQETVWTSFGTRSWSEQVDLDVNSPRTQQFFLDVLDTFSKYGVSLVRLDAIGYVIKKAGSSCFFVEPEIYEFLRWIQASAQARGISLLPELHAHYSLQFRLAAHDFWVYDFILPLLVLHTLLSGDSRKLQEHLQRCPRKQITTLDCHDGIPVQPDLDDVLSVAECQQVVDTCLRRGANINRILSPEHQRQPGFDAHQINITYYAALGEDDEAYIAARALQFFAPGVPQVYYVGLLAGSNDFAVVQESGEGRAVNRHNYSPQEVAEQVQRPVVRRLLELIRFRNEHPAFEGELQVLDAAADRVWLRWEKERQYCTLRLDLLTSRCEIEYSDAQGQVLVYVP